MLALAGCVLSKEKDKLDLDDYIEKPAKEDKNEELTTSETGYYGHHQPYHGHGVSYHHHHQPHYHGASYGIFKNLDLESGFC